MIRIRLSVAHVMCLKWQLLIFYHVWLLFLQDSRIQCVWNMKFYFYRTVLIQWSKHGDQRIFIFAGQYTVWSNMVIKESLFLWDSIHYTLIIYTVWLNMVIKQSLFLWDSVIRTWRSKKCYFCRTVYIVIKMWWSKNCYFCRTVYSAIEMWWSKPFTPPAGTLT